MDKMILLPLDGSETSLKALLPAKSIAEYLDMTIHILYISDETIPKSELMQKLRLQEEKIPVCMISHKKGNPVDVILRESKSADYIVMSTHGKTYDKTKAAGGVSIGVIERSEIPVLLVRPDVTFTIKKHLWTPKKVLIPLNGTPGAAQALTPAIDLLLKSKAEVDLLHIFSSKTEIPKEIGTIAAPYYSDYPQYEWASWSNEFLKRFCPMLKRNHIKFKLFVSKGDPAEEILSFVEKNNNDLIAMAWHGEFGHLHARILKEVIFKSPCPVLLVRIIS